MAIPPVRVLLNHVMNQGISLSGSDRSLLPSTHTVPRNKRMLAKYHRHHLVLKSLLVCWLAEMSTGELSTQARGGEEPPLQFPASSRQPYHGSSTARSQDTSSSPYM